MTGELPFTVLVPLYRTRTDHFREMVTSVLEQTFPTFELLLVDDGSGDDRLTALLAEAERSDPRVRVLALTENRGISGASQAGLDAARGTFVALLDHDDLLLPEALERVAAALERFPEADVLYSDEDQLHDDGELRTRFAKPRFSPERLRGQNYVNHLGVYRTALAREVGGFRTGFEGSQDYDLVLRVTERARLVVHIPEVLYHWRIHAASVSQSEGNAPVFDAARRALTEHLRRTGVRAEVHQVHPTGLYRIERQLDDAPPVTIVVPTRGTRSVVRGQERVLVLGAVRSVLESTTYPDYDVLVVADASTPADVRDELVSMAPGRVRVLDYPYPFNYSEKVNLGVVHARADLVVTLNDDTEIVTPDWLETMVGLLAPDVGMVGPQLRYEDGTLQHLGLHVSGGHVHHTGAGEPPDALGPFSAYWLEREVSGLTGACVLFPRAAFDAVGGLSPQLPVNFNDVDFCFKLLDAGYRLLVTPHAVVSHFESRSRPRIVGRSEEELLRDRWSHRLRGDEFWRHGTPAPDMVAASAPVREVRSDTPAERR
jgi:GT2 family glycosyltransferase